jgi:hypothetical protein
MIHRTDGLARRCSATDLFIVSGGIQCGNCLAADDGARRAQGQKDGRRDGAADWLLDRVSTLARFPDPPNAYREGYSQGYYEGYYGRSR